MIIGKEDLLLENVTSDESHRFAIQHIHVTKRFSEATNGRMLMRYIPKERGKDEDFPQTDAIKGKNLNLAEILINRKTAKEMIKTLPKKAMIPILQSVQCAEGIAVTTDLDKINQFRLNGNGDNGVNFPETENIINDALNQPCVDIAIDPHLLIQLFNAIICPVDNVAVRLSVPIDNTKAIVVRAEREFGEYLGLILPMQLEVVKSAYHVKLHGEIIRVMADNPMQAILDVLKQRNIDISVERADITAEMELPANVKGALKMSELGQKIPQWMMIQNSLDELYCRKRVVEKKEMEAEKVNE